MVRTRAPGGGRKPKGPVAARSQLTVRIPDDQRAELEAAARKRGRNLTDELLGRLRASFAREREQKRDPAMRAIGFLIAATAEEIHKQQSLSKDWQRNPFIFRAFRYAVAKLLEALDPPGEAKSPLNIKELRKQPENKLWQSMADWYETPEAAGSMAAESVLRELYRRAPLHPLWAPTLHEVDEYHPEFGGMGRQIAHQMEETFYDMSRVRHALGIDKDQTRRKHR